MVHGLEKFRNKFAKFSNMYVLIGGTACEILRANIMKAINITDL